MNIAVACFDLTRTLPREEQFGLSAQIRRAAASIAANIAEGHGREMTRSFIQFLRIAQGSLKELETHLLLAARTRMLRDDQVDPILGDCELLGRRMRAFIRSLQRRRSMDQ